MSHLTQINIRKQGVRYLLRNCMATKFMNMKQVIQIQRQIEGAHFEGEFLAINKLSSDLIAEANCCRRGGGG
jgi:hypothetical protein